MNWTAVGLALDFFGVLFLAASSAGVRRSRGYQSLGSWLTEGWPGGWLERRRRDAEGNPVSRVKSGSLPASRVDWRARQGFCRVRGGCTQFRTWGVVFLAITPGSLPDQVRGSLAKLMDQLVNDYLAVNP